LKRFRNGDLKEFPKIFALYFGCFNDIVLLMNASDLYLQNVVGGFLIYSMRFFSISQFIEPIAGMAKADRW
jgi:hypothetical protein